MSNKLCFRLGIVFIIICMVSLCLFNIYCNNNRLNADLSSELVLGKTMSEEGALISPEWCYSTEIRVLNYQLVTTPLFLLTDSWHAVRAISNMIFYILLLLSYIFLMTGTGIKKGYILFSSVLFLIPLSIESVDIIHIGGFYIPHFIVLFLTLGLYLRRESKKSLVILMILSFIAGISGIRYLLTIQLPLLLSAAFLYYKNDKKSVMTALYSFVFFGFGFVCNHFLHKIFEFYDETMVSFYGQGNPVERLGWIIDGLIQLLGFRRGAPVRSAEGIVSMMALFTTAVVVYLVYRKIRDYKAGERDFMFIFFAASFLANTFIFLVGSDQVFAVRYYFPVLIMLVPLAAKELSGEKIRAFAVGIAVCFAVITGIFTLYEASTYDRCENRYASIEYLSENGYDFGYSTFWNANITTELTNGKIRMANISEEFDEIKPYMWLTPKKYYDGRVTPEKPFILLTHDEYERAEGEFGSRIVYEDESFVILDGKPEFAND